MRLSGRVYKVISYAWYFSGLAAIVRVVCRRTSVRRGKIVFDNFHGRGFGDHQKYIAMELLRRHVGSEIVFFATDPVMAAVGAPPGIRFAPYTVSSVLRELATAEVWCTNQSWTDFIAWGLAKKSTQTYVQTFHGSLGIKRIGIDIPSGRKPRLWLRLLRRDAEMIDLLISNATWESEFVYRRRFFGCGRIALVGHPRNDVFFGDQTATRDIVRARYGLKSDERFVLYAPTYRAGGNTEALLSDYDELANACQNRFGGKWCTAVRFHPNWRNRKAPEGSTALDMTDYPDMQDLLVAADALVTDYSSCMFDFMLTRRPVFVYATDIAKYDTSRGFYYPLSETPFPIAHDMSELVLNIVRFNEEQYKERINVFLKEKGCVEDGQASKRVADLICKLLYEDN